MRLALADALDLVSVQAVNLAAALALSLLQNRRGLVERPFEDRLELLFAGNLAGDVADGPAEIGPQLAQRLVGRLELLGVCITLVLDQRQLADPHIGGANPGPPSRTSRSRAR
jgi:hypothetical protein